MKTSLTGKSTSVTIERHAPFTIIGEKINPVGNKKLAASLLASDYEYALDLARSQIEAGAGILDVSVGASGVDEVKVLPEVIKLLIDEIEVPICLDSPNGGALAAGLEVAPGKPLVNSVNGEEKSMEAILPIVKDRDAAVIGLTMDEDGIPNDAEKRFSIAEKILERAAKIGIPKEDVIIDPLVLAIGSDTNAGIVTLRTIELVSQHLGVNINLGASNVSFGLPDRHTINQAFLGLAIAAGATCAITDPLRLTPTIKALDLLLGRDEYAGRYIKECRRRAAKVE
jgi:5-methyltetrahydrofolate--homocysteine methyltransferase